MTHLDPQLDAILTPEQVMDGFHQFLQNSLAQAKLERIIDEETLASAEADVMICGPALCLFFAALRSDTNPPSVPIPGTARGGASLILSNITCPPVFQPYFRVWQNTVPAIQALPSAQQHDLARVICDNEPLTSPTSPDLPRIAADLRAVAIEISQRRTFQDRYTRDLQTALDVGQPTGGEKRRIASFRPPPSYEASEPSTSPVSSLHSSPQGPPHESLPSSPSAATFSPPPGPPPRQGGLLAAPVASGSGASRAHERGHGRTPSLADAPSIVLIRETLYAALADVIASTPSISPLIKTDPPRAYFSGVALAILHVAQWSITPTGAVHGVMGHDLTLQECPPLYRPLMTELSGIGGRVKQFEREDDERAIKAVRKGKKPDEPRMDRLRRMLETGVAEEEARYDRGGLTPPRPPQKEHSTVPRSTSSAERRQNPVPGPSVTTTSTNGLTSPSVSSEPRVSNESMRVKAANLLRKSPATKPSELPQSASKLPPRPTTQRQEAQPRRSEEGTTVQLANRINGLALKMTQLQMFKEQSDMVFKVLQSVT